MQTRRASLEDKTAYKRFLGLVSHEFFHTWNVKALRPAGITPYDYSKENYTKLLWVCEGTTSYYDDLTLARTGLMKTKDYLKNLASGIGSMRDHPGTRVQSLESSSFDAWIKFTAPLILRNIPKDLELTSSLEQSVGVLVRVRRDLAKSTNPNQFQVGIDLRNQLAGSFCEPVKSPRMRCRCGVTMPSTNSREKPDNPGSSANS